MDYKNATFEFKQAPDEGGEFEGYASIFDVVDNGLDVVKRGAFANSLARRKPKMLWQHDPERVIGVWDEIKEDERGLFVRGRLLQDVEKGREATSLIKAGAIDSMSIGYKTIQATPEGRARALIELDLFEVSIVTFPMNERSVVTAIKSVDWTNKRDVEAGLRDVFGLSQSEAKAFIADGFSGLTAKRDVGADEARTEALKELHSQIRQLQETLTHV